MVAAIWLAMPYAAPADDGGKGSSGTDKQISAKTIVGDWLLDEEVARERLQKAMSSNPSAARVYLEQAKAAAHRFRADGTYETFDTRPPDARKPPMGFHKGTWEIKKAQIVATFKMEYGWRGRRIFVYEDGHLITVDEAISRDGKKWTSPSKKLLSQKPYLYKRKTDKKGPKG